MSRLDLFHGALEEPASPGAKALAGGRLSGPEIDDRRLRRDPPGMRPALAVDGIAGAVDAGAEGCEFGDRDLVAEGFGQADEVGLRLAASSGEFDANRLLALLQASERPGARRGQAQRLGSVLSRGSTPGRAARAAGSPVPDPNYERPNDRLTRCNRAIRHIKAGRSSLRLVAVEPPNFTPELRRRGVSVDRLPRYRSCRPTSSTCARSRTERESEIIADG